MKISRASKILTLSLAATLVVSLIPQISNAAPKVAQGSTCKTLNKKTVAQDKIFTCIRKGNKLVWSKGLTIKNAASSKNPTPKATPQTSPITSSSNSSENISNQVCTRENEIVRNSLGEFWCLKSNDDKLRWSKNNVNYQPAPSPVATINPTPIATPKPTPTPTITANVKDVAYAPPAQPGSNIDLCKIKDLSIARINAEPGKERVGTGFPEMNSVIPTKGTIKWALIPIDFSDLPGESNFRSRVDDQMRTLTEWYETVSEGKLKIDWVVQDKWVRLPDPSKEYSIDRSDNLDRAKNGIKLWTDAMRASDAVFDFTDIQTVNFILPKGQTFLTETSQGFPQDDAVINLKTNEGKVRSFSIPGQYFDLPGHEYWSYWAHEFGHAIGIGHVGSSRESNPFSYYDLLGSQDGPSRELSGWFRFFAGWLPAEKLHCQDFSKLTTNEITLVPLSSSDSGLKVVVIPTTATKAVVIESRRVTKFDCKTPNPRNGVLVYTYDATLGHGEVLFKAVTPNERPLEMDECGLKSQRNGPSQNLLLTEGDKVSVDGITVEVLLHGNRDRIRISKGN